MQKPSLKGKNVLVLGLGLHGGSLWLIKWLCSQGARVTVSDLKSAKDLASTLDLLKKFTVKYVFGSHPESLLKGCDMVFQNPAVPREASIIKKARSLYIPVENEASLFFKIIPTNKVVAITGSKGKSTTTSLLGEIVKSKFKNTVVAGNIRDTVMFQGLKKINKQTTAILELSSWQLELMGEHRIRVPVAMVTNILPDHLNRYKSMADYAQAKANIFKYQKKEDVLILNADNDWCLKMAKQCQSQIYWFSVSQPVKTGCFVEKGIVKWRDLSKTENILTIKSIKLLGVHNLENILAAVVGAKVCGVPNKNIQQTVQKFTGLHDRMELVREVKGVKYINDTAATAPVASSAALKSWPRNKVVVIVGGQDKKLPYQDLVKDLKKYAAHVVMLPGTASNKILLGLKNFKKISLVSDMETAVIRSAQVAKRGQVVLLSPGAASFNLFKHEFDRGQQFIKFVKKLK